jgi:hypothetical protein
MAFRFLIIILLLCASSKSAMTQYGNRIYITDTEIPAADSQQLFLRFRSATFMNNKEHFNPYQPGYTLIGYFAVPTLEYHPGPATRLKAGIHLLKYSGREKFSRFIPVFSFQHRFAPGVDMVFGALHGALNHGLIEPLFSFERIFTNNHESGLQFLIDREWFTADIWLDWERFIFTGDPFQEEFSAGLSSKVLIIRPGNRLRVELPFQLLATHRGGQIDISDERMQTLVNIATGINIDMDLDHDFFRVIGFRGYIAFFRDQSPAPQYPYENGWGIYPNLFMESRFFQSGVGYWRGHRFVAPRGEPVFQSVSQVDPVLAVNNRELITSKIILNRKLVRGINMGLRFEGYFDTASRNFDHTMGLHVMIDERFFITRLKKR